MEKYDIQCLFGKKSREVGNSSNP